MSGSKGEAFLAEADKCLNRTTIFGFGKKQKFEDAAEAFKKAGNAFKLANLWESAGKAFLKSADCQLQVEEANDAATQFVEAGNCFKKIDAGKAVKALKKAIEIYNEAGRFSQSARYYKDMAEICEADGNSDAAMDAYQQAANLFVGKITQSTCTTHIISIVYPSVEF
jgi:alpha-soluble NSF attachment protein